MPVTASALWGLFGITPALAGVYTTSALWCSSGWDRAHNWQREGAVNTPGRIQWLPPLHHWWRLRHLGCCLTGWVCLWCWLCLQSKGRGWAECTQGAAQRGSPRHTHKHPNLTSPPTYLSCKLNTFVQHTLDKEDSLKQTQTFPKAGRKLTYCGMQSHSPQHTLLGSTW